MQHLVEQDAITTYARLIQKTKKKLINFLES